MAQLKERLRGNDQKVSGTKHELIQRIGDCLVYGAMPRCPECKAAKLRVLYSNNKPYGHGGKGRYYCPGYYDDEDYKACGWTGDETQIERTKWKEPEEV